MQSNLNFDCLVYILYKLCSPTIAKAIMITLQRRHHDVTMTTQTNILNQILVHLLARVRIQAKYF